MLIEIQKALHLGYASIFFKVPATLSHYETGAWI